MNTLELLAHLRGGHPSKCDFCGKHYSVKENRVPIPEKGGVWACSECYTRWGEEHAKRNVK